MGVAGMDGDIVWFVLQDDYIPYPSIDEVGAPGCLQLWVLSLGRSWGS